jgi:hypothetical protein
MDGLQKLFNVELERTDGHVDLVVFQDLWMHDAQHADAPAVVHNVGGPELAEKGRICSGTNPKK